MKFTRTICLTACIILMYACVPSNGTPASVHPTLPPTISQSGTPEPSATMEPFPFPLSGPGPYPVGKKLNIAFEDASRGGRKVTITIWYPAVHSQDSTSSDPIPDAMPELTNAPYPLILSSSKVGRIFASHLVSHGFVYVGIDGQDSKDHWGQWLTDYPLDLIFALNQIASNPLTGLENMIDTNRAGALGYSFDGYTSLALSGARVDPEFYLTQCENASSLNPAPAAWWVDYICNPAGGWDELVGNAGSSVTTSDDGLWKAMTDDRILAVMPMAPEGAWLFGERGLAAADRPTLIIGATSDDINIYGLEATYIFEHISAPNRTMISFVGKGHMMIYDAESVSIMKHFSTAFFGYYLQMLEDYSKYFSQDFIAQHNNLAWGVETE